MGENGREVCVGPMMKTGPMDWPLTTLSTGCIMEPPAASCRIFRAFLRASER